MSQQLIRTTVQLDPLLFQQAKLKAAQEKTTLKHLINLGLEAVVRGQLSATPKSKSSVRFGGHNLGKIKGKLSRKEIYEDRLASVTR